MVLKKKESNDVDLSAPIEEVVEELHAFKAQALAKVADRIRNMKPVPCGEKLSVDEYMPYLKGYKQCLDNIFYILEEEAK